MITCVFSGISPGLLFLRLEHPGMFQVLRTERGSVQQQLF